ncbi:MAG: hypothetical protein KDK00_03755 [Rhodobacteraceae bacterium]|nr:hypothetical protein [Paracoccaceae bacterium]
MKPDRIADGPLDYCLYRYGRSKVLYRGPRPDFKRPYCAFLGSSETFGKFVATPFPALLQDGLAMPCANFAALNAGVEMYLKDPSILLATAEARVTVIAVMGAHNLSNRFYQVHPRRNDRFVRSSKMLQTLYRGIDCTDIHFTRHLLATLLADDPVKFGIVVEEMKAAWVARMKSLLEAVEGRTILLWAATHAPGERDLDCPEGLGEDPLFIDQSMMDELSPLATEVVECICKPETKTGTNGMRFAACDAGAAAQLPGPDFHAQVAQKLEPALRRLI